MLIEDSLAAFSDKLAAKTPAPGGGAAGAYTGAMGAALGLMDLRFSKTQGPEAELEAVRKCFLELVDEDTEAYNAFDAALKLPKGSAERTEAMGKALLKATQVPLSGMEEALQGLQALKAFAAQSNKNLASDLASAAILFQAAARILKQNVVINTRGGKNPELAARAVELERQVDALTSEVLGTVETLYAQK